MSDRTTTSTSAPTTPATPNDQAARDLLGAVPLYAAASAEQRLAIEADMAGMLRDGMAAEDYLSSLASWSGDAAHYLATLPAADQGEINPAQDAAVKAEQAAREAEAKEQAARKECQGTLAALVKAYRAGERAYRQGLLEAGRLSVEYIARRLAIGDRRSAATQAIEGQLAAVSSDAVDVSRLVRCWESYRLLAVAQGLDQPETKGKAAPADAVPYGHYRDGWSLLLVRQNRDTPEETFALLPGLEDKCLAAFKHAVAEGLSKAAVIDQGKALVQEHAKREADLAAAERAEKARAEREAQERAAAERAARETAEQEERAAADRLAATTAAERAADDQQREQAAKDRAAAEEQARKAKAEADRKRAAEEAAAREAARAKREALDAARRQADAEALKAKEEQRRLEREQRQQQKAAGRQQQQPPAESRQGTNLLAAARKATPKDAADLLRSVVQGHDDPHAVLHDLVVSLLANPSAGLSTDDVVRTVFLALDAAKLPGQLGDAVRAARLVLNRKVKPADQPASHPSTKGQVCAA